MIQKVNKLLTNGGKYKTFGDKMNILSDEFDLEFMNIILFEELVPGVHYDINMPTRKVKHRSVPFLTKPSQKSQNWGTAIKRSPPQICQINSVY